MPGAAPPSLRLGSGQALTFPRQGGRDYEARYLPWYILVSGLKAATANQNELVWTTGVSFFPDKGPSTASPWILQTLPVSLSTILSPSFLKVCLVPSKVASKSPAAPILFESAILPQSRAERVPGLKKPARSVPPTL